jgi:acyl-CoA thioester hydrolase
MTTQRYEQTITIRWADIDATCHLRHSAYADWATHVRTEWLNARGFTLKVMSELRVAPIIFEENIRYFKEIYLGEKVVVDLALVGLSGDAARYHLRQHFRRGDIVCARYELKGGWIDTDKRCTAPPPPGLLDATSDLGRTGDYADIAAAVRSAE